MIKKILVIEDDKVFQRAIADEFGKYEGLEPIFAPTYADAMKLFRQHRGALKFALVDLNLPDANSKDVVSMVSAHRIPYIIYSSSLDNSSKEFIFEKNAIDYVTKTNKNSLEYAIKKIDSYVKTRKNKILLVDDSKLARKAVIKALETINIEVIECENGEEAFALIGLEEKNIALVITDYQMPKMDGLELCMRIRSHYNKDELAIIAMSSVDDRKSINHFLQVGANDFIIKPIDGDETLIKVQSQLEMLDLFQRTKDLANKDPMTGAYNRRFFFDAASAIVDKSKRKQAKLAVAMIDIDKFKLINDTYGHAIGDIAIKECINILNATLRGSDLVARFGGEEFVVLLEDISQEDTEKLFENVRAAFEANSITQGDITLSYTVSIGICYQDITSIDDSINSSDEALYEAKEGGRNRVVVVG